MTMKFNDIFVMGNRDNALNDVFDAELGQIGGGTQPAVEGLIAYSMTNQAIVNFNFNATKRQDPDLVIQAVNSMIGVVDGERARAWS